jgi:hypothetical protein
VETLDVAESKDILDLSPDTEELSDDLEEDLPDVE